MVILGKNNVMTLTNEDYSWKVATLVSYKMVAADVKSMVFTVDPWIQPKAGQHYDIRLTSENGYQAERAYSIASAPEDNGVVEFGVQLLSDGEVSPYLFQMTTGDQVEIKGPIGGHFIWDTEMPGPLVLIGGGSGMVPLMSMLRHRYAKGDTRETVFLISARTIDHILYREELEAHVQNDSNVEVVMTLTENQPMGWLGYDRRVDKEMLDEVLGTLLNKTPNIYICGPNAFVEAVSRSLIDLAIDPSLIRTERFGG